jgi:hypothetical protein
MRRYGEKEVSVKYLAFIFLILFSFESNSSIEIIDEHEFTDVEYKKLGFLEIGPPANDRQSYPRLIYLTYPKKFKSKFEVLDVFIEGKDDKGTIFKTTLKIEHTDNDLLSGSFVSLIKQSDISLSVYVKYIDFNSKNSISVGHLIKLGNIDLFPKTTYSNFIQWKVSP